MKANYVLVYWGYSLINKLDNAFSMDLIFTDHQKIIVPHFCFYNNIDDF